MGKDSHSQKGFSVVEICLALALFAIIGFVGWQAWQSRSGGRPINKSAAQTNQSVSNGPPAGFTVYEDDFLRFAYPSDWKVEKQYTFSDAYGALLVNLKSPIDKSMRSADGADDLYFSGSILVAKNSRFSTTCTHCEIFATDKVSPKDPASDGALAVVAAPGQTLPTALTYTRDTHTFGNANYDNGFVVGQSYVGQVSGSFMSGTSAFTALTSGEAFQATIIYQQLLQIIPTIEVKTSALPQ